MISVIFRQQDRRGRATCFRDDPECRAVGGAMRGQNPHSAHQSPVVDLFILGIQFTPIANYMAEHMDFHNAELSQT